jgi:hypothetical protein
MPVTQRKLNRFRFGNPVPPRNFIGRKQAIRTTFDRINKRESTAVVGEPHIGKTSLLAYIADKDVRSEWLGANAGYYGFMKIDCHLLASSDHPSDFWRLVLDWIKETFPREQIQVQLDVVRQSSFGSFTLKTLFDRLADEKQCVVLIIDEFDILLHHANFINTAEFFGALRSLSTITEGLVLVTASRMSINEMNVRTLEINPLASPFFNTVLEIRLPPLRSYQVTQLIDLSLEGTGINFSVEDRAHIERLTGRYPYLVQIASATLFDAIVSGKNHIECYQEVNRALQSIANAHFEDLWRHLPAAIQRTLFFLAAVERSQPDHNLGSLEQLLQYDYELHWLDDGGLIESTNEGQGISWRNDHWRVRAEAFAQWMIDNHKWKDLSLTTQAPLISPEQRAGRIQTLRELIIINGRRLQELQKQAATFGINVPPHINMEIEDLQLTIEDLEREMRASVNQGLLPSDLHQTAT